MGSSLLVRSFFVSAGVLALAAACTSGGSGDPPGTTVSEAGPDASTTSDATTTDDRVLPAPQGKFSFTGVHDEPTPPVGSKAVVVWNVFAGSPDYSYVFGGGSTAGADVYISFTTDPPAEALNGNKIGIGLIYVFDASYDIPEGKITKSSADAQAPQNVLKGVSARHAVIFRNSPDQATSAGWDLAFPQGFACGVCEDREAGFDAFIQIDCSQMTVVPYIDGTTKICNFT